MTPLVAALTLVGLGVALLVTRGVALRGEDEAVPAGANACEEEMPRPEPAEEPRTPPAAIAGPSEIARAAKRAPPRPAPAAPDAAPSPVPPPGEEPPLSRRQRERVERLMAAVRSEFDGLIAEEKRRRTGEA